MTLLDQYDYSFQVEAERERQGEEARTESRQLAKLPGKKLAHG